jgi:uncharacterized protein involved in outer membrane biogenesis
MRLFWRALAVLGGIVVLLLVAVAIAIHSVDVKEFIGPLQQRVKEATGRDLTVKGDIDLKLGLEPKLVIDDVSLGNASWGKQPQMITAKHLEAQIALLPLLRKRFEITRFKLVEPSIALETDKSGNGNWEFPSLVAAASAKIATPAPSGGTLGALAIGDLAITDGSLTYRDGRTGDVTTVVIEDLTVHARDASSPISGRFRGRINDTPIALEGDFGPLEQFLRQRWPYPVTVQGNVNEKKTTLGTQMTVEGNNIKLAPLQVGYGSTQLTGELTLISGGPRPKLVFKLAAPTMTLAELAATTAANVKAVQGAAQSRYIFGEQPIDIAALKSVDATGDLAIDKLVLPDGQHIDQLKVQLTLLDGKLDVPVLQAVALGGNVNGRVQLDASRAPDAPLALNVDAKGLDLAAVLAAGGVKRDIKGGKVDLKADLSARGASPRQWASSASGNLLVTVGAATLINTKANDATIDQLAGAVNPFKNVDPTTELHCAVARLPLRGGVASIDRSIAIETNKLGASASGTIDLRSETLDLSIKPQLRQGIPINITQIAELVRLHGPLSSPTVGVDAMAAAATAARIGAAMAAGGGGLAVLGSSFLAQPAGDPSSLCQVALTGRSGGAAQNASAQAGQPQSPANELNQALGKLLGR